MLIPTYLIDCRIPEYAGSRGDLRDQLIQGTWGTDSMRVVDHSENSINQAYIPCNILNHQHAKKLLLLQVLPILSTPHI